MASVGTFLMYLEQTATKSNKEIAVNSANGISLKQTKSLDRTNSKDWRERFVENLPFKLEETMLVNLPPKIDIFNPNNKKIQAD